MRKRAAMPMPLIPNIRRGRPKKSEPEVGPTPETALKLEPDQLSVLLEKGAITPDQERTGRALHSFMLALQTGMSPVSKLRSPSNPAKRRAGLSPLDRLRDRDFEYWDEIYKPWAARASRIVVCRRPKLTQLELIRRIVDDNVSIDRIASRHSLAAADILDAVTGGLDLYNAQKREK